MKKKIILTILGGFLLLFVAICLSYIFNPNTAIAQTEPALLDQQEKKPAYSPDTNSCEWTTFDDCRKMMTTDGMHLTSLAFYTNHSRSSYFITTVNHELGCISFGTIIPGSTDKMSIEVLESKRITRGDSPRCFISNTRQFGIDVIKYTLSDCSQTLHVWPDDKYLVPNIIAHSRELFEIKRKQVLQLTSNQQAFD